MSRAIAYLTDPEILEALVGRNDDLLLAVLAPELSAAAARDAMLALRSAGLSHILAVAATAVTNDASPAGLAAELLNADPFNAVVALRTDSAAPAQSRLHQYPPSSCPRPPS
jgi:hypothetical protein